MGREDAGVVPPDLLGHVPNWETLYEKGYRWLEYQVNMCDLAQTLAAADLFWPPLIEVDGCVLLNVGAGLRQSIESLRQLYGADQNVERKFNIHRLIDLVTTDTEAQLALAYDDSLITAFGVVLQTFWTMRLSTAFPNRTFRVEMGDDIGEEGLAITFYQT